MSSFEQLLACVRACEECKAHLPLGPRPVVRLTEDIRILIISQAPGVKVHNTGLPFNDISGDRLRSWLNLTREQFYNDNIIGFMPMGFCYPGKGKGGDLPPRPECAEKWHDLLVANLKNVELTLLIGSYAILHYWPNAKGKTLTEIVRSWSGENLIPLVHPSPRNKMWVKKNPWFENSTLPKLKNLIKKFEL